MGASVNVFEEIVKLFSACQETASCHQKNSLLLRKLYQQTSLKQFWEAFSSPISTILNVDFKIKNPNVERLIEYVGVFCAALKGLQPAEECCDEELFTFQLFEYLLQGSRDVSHIVRFRSCQLINKIVEHLKEFEISEALCEDMRTILIHRLLDPKEAIRLQAIKALYRLQNPGDPDDPLISLFIENMQDTKSKVRELCVEKIACRRDVINCILKRTRDVDVKVRLAAFKRLSKFAKVVKLPDRRTILLSGILDTSDKIRDYIFTEFLTCWCESYDDDITVLMKALRLNTDENDIEITADLHEHVLNKFYFKNRTLQELLEVLPLNDEKLVPYDKLNWETVIYWRLIIKLFVTNDCLSTHLESVIPELVFLCQYVKGYADYPIADQDESYLEKQYIIQNLFLIIRACDLSDSHTVKNVHLLIVYLLKKGDLMDNTIEAIMGTLIQTLPDSEKRCQFGMEIISDLLNPIDTEEELQEQQEREFKIAQLKVRLVTLKQDQETAVMKADYIEANRLKQEIENTSFQVKDLSNTIQTAFQGELKRTDDPATICQCLDIAWAILRCANVDKLTPTLRALKDLLPEYLVDTKEIVRFKALRCYAICCIYDKATAVQGIHIFAIPILAYQAGEECDTQTLLSCIAAVSDLIRIYGADLMAEPNEDQMSDSVSEEHQKVFTGGTSLTSLVQGLVDLMDDEQPEVQLKATEGLSKLVLDEKIHSPSLISRLILKWCQPDEEGQVLKQFIGHVLAKLPNLPNSARQLEGSVLLTIHTLLKAPKNSPLADVDIDNIAKFVLSLCKLSSQGQKIHSNIALSLCKKINEDPDNNKNSRHYSKMLLMLDLPEDKDIIEEMFALANEGREYISDRISLRNITKFLSRLNEILAEPMEASQEGFSNSTEDEENHTDSE